MNIGSQFKTIFDQAVRNQESSGLLLEFNIYRIDNRYKTFAFVEAKGDADFYSSTTVEILRNDSCKYISAGQNSEEVLVGKKAVLHALVDIDDDSTLQKYISKCIFIVDQDYDPKLECCGVKLSKKQKEYVSITKGYSFENYYFQKDNISYLLRSLDLDAVLKRQIKKDLIDFVLKKKEYFAAKGVISLFYSELEKRPRMHKHKEIFAYDFHTGNIVDEKKYAETLENMMETIRTNNLLKQEYEVLLKRITEEPLLYARGHDVFDYFVNCIRYNGDNLTKRDWKRLNKELIVEFISC